METEDVGSGEAVAITGDTESTGNEAPHDEREGSVLAGDEGEKVDPAEAGEEQVIEFVVEDSATAVTATDADQEASSVTLLPMADGAKTIEAITTADGSIAYIQVCSMKDSSTVVQSEFRISDAN